MPRIAAAALIVLSVALTSSCGSDDASQTGPAVLSQSQYQESITEIVTNSAKASSLYTDLVLRQPQGKCAELMVSFHREVEQLIGRAAELQAPQDVAPVHARLVDVARDSVDRVGEIESDVVAGDLACGKELNDQLYGMPSTEDARDAISELEDQGYVVFSR